MHSKASITIAIWRVHSLKLLFRLVRARRHTNRFKTLYRPISGSRSELGLAIRRACSTWWVLTNRGVMSRKLRVNCLDCVFPGRLSVWITHLSAKGFSLTLSGIVGNLKREPPHPRPARRKIDGNGQISVSHDHRC
jgi:hypothetical protein